MLLNTFISNNFVGAAAGGGGPVVVDSEEASNTAHRTYEGVGGSTNTSWTFTNTAGTLLVVGVVVTNSTQADSTITAPTANGTPMTLLGSQLDCHGNGKDKLAIYYMTSPPTGSVAMIANGSCTASGTPNLAILAGAISFTGNSASSPFGTPVTDVATSGTHALSSGVTTASGNYVFAVGNYGAGAAATADSGQIATFKVVGSGNTAADDICAVTKASTGSSIAAGFTWSGSDNWAIMAVAIQA